MNRTAFAKLVKARCKKIVSSLVTKQREYASGSDCLHNFKRAAELRRCSPKQALFGMLTKHLVSLVDMVESDTPYTLDIWNEKLGDSINYLILLEAIVIENTNENPDA